MSKDEKDKLIKEVQELYKKLGRTPRTIDFRNNNMTEVYKYFGTWNNLLSSAGLNTNLVKTDHSKYTKDEILSILKNELNRIESTSLSNYIKLKSDEAPSFYYIRKATGLHSWHEILKKIGKLPGCAPRKFCNNGKNLCNADDCNELATAKGYCAKHYEQIRRLGYVKDEKTEDDLRQHIEYMRNRNPRNDNKLGVKGVRVTKTGRFEVRIIVDYKEKWLGSYGTLSDAIQARIDGEKKYWGKSFTSLEDYKEQIKKYDNKVK